MNRVPAEFVREIRTHNRQCVLAAASGLFLGWLAWVVLYAAGTGAVLLGATVVGGHEAGLPGWWHPAAAAAAGVLLAWGGVDAWRSRYRPPRDGPVVGWHLVPDCFLLAPRLTYGIAANLSARIRLRKDELAECWRLLCWIAENGRTPAHSLGSDFSCPATLHKALDCLSVLGWIDLHRGEDGFFYLLRSSRAEELRGLADGDPESPEDERQGQ